MAGVTFNGPGAGDTIADPGQFDVITISDPDPYDLSDISQFNASMSPGCSCDEITPEQPPLHVCAHPFLYWSFLFRRKELQQLSPISLSGSDCIKLPIASLDNGIRFHAFEDGILDRQLKASKDDPTAIHSRVSTRMLSSSSSGAFSKSLYQRGWEAMYGDQPGYKKGREITFDSGKVKRGILTSDVYKKIDLTFTVATDANGEKYTILRGMQGYYVRDITIYYSPIIDNVTDRRFHMIFRYDVAADANCSIDSFRKQKIIDQEDIIDNIGVTPSIQRSTYSQNSPQFGSPSEVLTGNQGTGNYVTVDTRYSTADFIELRGYQLKIVKVIAYALQPSDYFDNVLKSDYFAASFDARGRLFVFYEDQMNYTKLPYVDFTCAPKSSSSALPTPVPNPTPSDGGGVDMGGGGGGGAGAGGGGGGGGAGGGGIPGFPPGSVTYENSSSSSSGSPSSSSSSGSGSSPSSSSSSSADTTPPPPVINPAAGALRDGDGDGYVHLTWDVPPGTTVTGQPDSGSSSSSQLDEITFCIEHAVGDIEGPYEEVVCGLTTTQYDTYVCGTPKAGKGCAVEGEWNYYKIYAVDKAGNKSTFLIIQIFLVLPKPCVGRDCVGCVTEGFKSRNSFTIFFSQPSKFQLAFKCDACDGTNQNNPPFVRILEEAFFESQLSQLEIGSDTSSGNKVPVKFCLLQSCDKNVQNECKWENTFYIPALTNACAGFGCVQGFEKVLVPMTITLTQSSAGWSLDVYAMGPDCKRLNLFKTDQVIWDGSANHPCDAPVRFVSKLPMGPAQINGTATDAATTDNPCAVNPPDAFVQHTGTISVAMSPDLGETWYNFPGVIQINKDKQAIRPVIAHDEKTNTFHLLYVERDYIDENSQLLIQGFQNGKTGFDARVLHVRLKADYFKEVDAFIPFYPAPDDTVLSSSTATGPIGRPLSGFYQLALKNFSPEGQILRTVEQSQVVYEEAVGTTTISLTDENNSAFVDNQGRLQYVRFKQAGTLVDPPDRLTRRRRKTASCGTFTWTVSGITDSDCSCQSLLGSFRLELNDKTANYEDSNWTLSVDDTYNYWVMTAYNGMLVFKKKRDITQCPPTGAYTITCNRCQGSISGTLDVERVSIQGRDAAFIDNGDFVASATNLTDFGNVPLTKGKENEFVIWNKRPTPLSLTGNPIIAITGADASDFSVTQSLPSIIPPYEYRIFAIKFAPSSTGKKSGGVRIVNDSDTDNPYVFNIKGNGIPNDQGGSSSSSGALVSSDPPGIVFSADAVGTFYISTDEGTTWSEKTMDFKTGQYATCTFDRKADALYVLYVTDDMLFARRYPSLLYTNVSDVDTDLDPAFDGFNIVDPPEIVLPDENAFLNDAIGEATGGDLGSSLGALGDLQSAFGLPNIKTPGDVVDTFEEDLISKKTQLKNEKDTGGLPIFLVGNRNGALINGYYPYPPQYVFNENTSVSRTKPAAYITSTGSVRFFYTDLNGNINAGTLSAESPSIDIKRKSI